MSISAPYRFSLIVCATMANLLIAVTTTSAVPINVDSSNFTGTLASNGIQQFTVSGANDNRMLVVGVAGEATTQIANITYGGVALTRVSDAFTSGSIAEVWVLDNVNAGQAPLAVTTGGGVQNGYRFGIMSLFSDGDLFIADEDSTTANSGSSATLNLDVLAEDFVFGIGNSNGNTNIGTTDLANNLFASSQGGAGFSMSGDFENDPGVGSFEWTWSSSQRHALAGVVVRAASAIPEPTTATLGLIGLAGLLVRRRRAA